MRGLLIVAVGAAWGALTACGAIRSTSILIDATAEVDAARAAGAPEAAPYEFVSAEAYLQKAREEQGYADFEVSVAFGKLALACARAAIARVNGEQPPTDPGVEPQPAIGCQPARRLKGGGRIERITLPGLKADPAEPKDPLPLVVPLDDEPAEPSDPEPPRPPASEPATPEPPPDDEPADDIEAPAAAVSEQG